MLPVSGIELVVREPTGQDELYILENTLPPMPALLGLASRVARTTTDVEVDWTGLPATDLDAAALIIRRTWLGDSISTDTRCPESACGERIDVAFRIGDYLSHHAPRRPRGTSEATEPGWFVLAGTDVQFRVPTVGDVLAARSQDSPADELLRRCVRAPAPTTALARRLHRGLSALAPSLNDLVGGACPACGRLVELRFDPIGYTFADLRAAFAGIHYQTHAIAAAYGWPEETILALPRSRRNSYASIIADERSVA